MKNSPGTLRHSIVLLDKFVGIHTARRNFRFFIAFRAGWQDNPFVELMLQLFERAIRPRRGRVQFQPARGKPLGENSLEGGSRRSYF